MEVSTIVTIGFILFGAVCTIAYYAILKYHNKKKSHLSNRANIPQTIHANALVNDILAERRRMEQQAIEIREGATQLPSYTARPTRLHNIHDSVSAQSANLAHCDLPPSYESVVGNVAPRASPVNAIN